MNVKKLNIARKKIDILDRSIFNLIKKRTKIVKYMLSLKKYKKDIVDYKRINTILKNIRRKSIQNNIDPMITAKIWKTMIWSYIEFQRKKFKRK